MWKSFVHAVWNIMLKKKAICHNFFIIFIKLLELYLCLIQGNRIKQDILKKLYIHPINQRFGAAYLKLIQNILSCILKKTHNILSIPNNLTKKGH